ncbi:hypothetical protein BGZ95_008788 [Linnemannia exigua]|uniref:FAD-binding domain-containing protein n=1 Tax=Linnemannia exigua TaxID=604196 RepID=A0AAD4HB32_9FUNG|nr:hypothetical protein BGZ95_008788 [Linnemannia exigua]
METELSSLVGADGDYSGVRKVLYKTVSENIGTTGSLDPVKYPGIDDEIAHCSQIIGKNMEMLSLGVAAPKTREGCQPGLINFLYRIALMASYILIIGAGLAGIHLAILLAKAGIPYQIFERAKEIKPLWAVMSLNAGILPVLEQLRIYEELLHISLLVTGEFKIYNSVIAMILAPRTYLRKRKRLSVYNHIVFARPEFYKLLLSKMPAENIHFNKKVMTTYHGDIIVGADGASSGVRQALFKRLEKSGQLPLSDAIELNKGFICMVGTTSSLDPAKYPSVDDKVAQCNQIIGKNNYYTAAEHKFRNSEWGQEPSDLMIKEVRDFLIPFGGNLGNLIDATPRDNISRVFLEDKLFDTWHHGRTVLIGDACHKLLPSSGLGAIVAMQDAVALANCLYEMKDLTPENISNAFSTFKGERFGRVKGQFKSSRTSAQLFYGQSLSERLLRMVVFNWLPGSLQRREVTRERSLDLGHLFSLKSQFVD